MSTSTRRSVRVLCVDASHRVLMMCWRDPFNGATLWEAPGGGVEPGESDRDTAIRELAEETSLDVAALLVDPPVDVVVDIEWNGSRHRMVEPYFLARFDSDRPDVDCGSLLADEAASLVEYEWIPWNEPDRLPGRHVPADLRDVLNRLGDGPWRAPQHQ